MKLMELVTKYISAKNLEEKAKRLQDELKPHIIRGMKSNNVKSHIFKTKEGQYNVTQYLSEQVFYDYKVMSELIDEDVLEELTTVKLLGEVSLSDFRRLLKTLCHSKMEKRLLLSILGAKKEIDKNKLQEKFDIGEIDIEDIRKARKVSRITDSLKVSKIKEDQDGDEQ